MQPKFKIYCDMDGVLVDFVKGIKELIPDYSEERYETDKRFNASAWQILKQYTKDGNTFWLDLEPMDDMMQLWNYIYPKGNPYDTEILTATGMFAPASVAEQKELWIRREIEEDVPVNTVQKARDKAEFAKEPNFILIDDKLKAIEPWRDAGGIGIVHTSAVDTIKQLKALGI